MTLDPRKALDPRIEVGYRQRLFKYDENAKAAGQPANQIVDFPADGFPTFPPLRQHILDYLDIRPEAIWVRFHGDPELYDPDRDPSPIESAMFFDADIEPRLYVQQMLRYFAYGVAKFDNQGAFDSMVTLLSCFALQESPTNDIEGIPPDELLQIKWLRYMQGSKESLATVEEVKRAEEPVYSGKSNFADIMRKLRTGERDPRPQGPSPDPTMRGLVILEQLKFDDDAVWMFHNYAGRGRVYVMGPTSRRDPTQVDRWATDLLRKAAIEALERTSEIPFLAGVIMVMFDRQSCVNEDPTNRFLHMQYVAQELSQDFAIPMEELKQAKVKAERILKTLDRQDAKDLLSSIELYVDRPQLAYLAAGPTFQDKIEALEQASLARTERNRRKKQRKLDKQPGNNAARAATDVKTVERTTKAKREEKEKFDEDPVLTDLWALD